MLTAPSISRPAFVTDVRAEVLRLFRPPRLELRIIAFNALVVCVGWVVLPAGLKEWLFDNLHGPLAFVLVLETWMIGDVTSTNLLAHDAPAALDALRQDRLGYVVRVKAAALALVIGLPCALVALVKGIASGHALMVLPFVPAVLAVPFAAVAVASWLGVLLPYSARSLRWRWEHRHSIVDTVRWAFLVLVPYTLVSAIMTALIFPAKLLADSLTHHVHRTHHPTMSAVVVTAGLVCALSVAVFAYAPRVAAHLGRSRRGPLVAYFEDADAG